MNPLDSYTKIQELVRNEARQIAEQVYAEKGTQYNVADVPTHSHNGVDSVQLNYKDIIQGNKYTGGASEDVTETATLGGVFNPTRIAFAGFAANNAISSVTLDGDLPTGNKTVTGAFGGGENSATLTASWTGTTGIFQVTFSNGDVRNVQFTHGSTGITWSGVLTGAATATIHVDGAAGTFTLSSAWTGDTGARQGTFSNGDVRTVTLTNGSVAGIFGGAILTSSATDTITIGASKRAIINGEIDFGTCFLVTDPTPPIVISTSGPGDPFLQYANYMYIDSNTLNKNRVGFTTGSGADATAAFIYAADDTGSVVAVAQLTSFNNQLGILTIDFTVATGWKIQGALTVT